MFDDKPVCDDCGNRILYPQHHERVCSSTATFDGECPMCGEPYETYFQHLEDCSGGR
jgi:ribosomal protein S27E